MTQWWRDAVFYQVYPRSFADSDGDGQGDLAGLTARLGDIAALGVDALWLTPFYPSPMVDGGYDVADYTEVDPRYGDLEAFDRLVGAAHAVGLRVTIDLVPNHCSSEHEWFRAALAAGPGSPERERFLFRPGRGDDGSEPPTNWRSAFGGSSWTRVGDPAAGDGEWYYHLFDPGQPDFNWDHPDVGDEFERILRFWLDRGVDGFRIDVSDALVKDFAAGDTVDANPVIPKGEDSALHEHYRRMRRTMDSYPGERMAVLETGASAEDVARLVRSDEMHLAFNLALAKARWNAPALHEAIEEGLAVSRLSGAPATWVIENHDLPRAVTRYGSDVELVGEYVPDVTNDDDAGVDLALGTRRARAAAVLACSLPGALYLYQGQELGLPEVTDLPDEVREDPVFFRSGGSAPGRDGCRVPLPWEGEAAPYGFGPAGSTPWLPQPDVFAELSRAAQEGTAGSMLELYRELLAVRREHAVLRRGALEWLSEGALARADVLAFRLRHADASAVVVVNTGEATVPLPVGEVIAASVPREELAAGLPGNAAVTLLETPPAQ